MERCVETFKWRTVDLLDGGEFLGRIRLGHTFDGECGGHDSRRLCACVESRFGCRHRLYFGSCGFFGERQRGLQGPTLDSEVVVAIS